MKFKIGDKVVIVNKKSTNSTAGGDCATGKNGDIGYIQYISYTDNYSLSTRSIENPEDSIPNEYYMGMFDAEEIELYKEKETMKQEFKVGDIVEISNRSVFSGKLKIGDQGTVINVKGTEIGINFPIVGKQYTNLKWNDIKLVTPKEMKKRTLENVYVVAPQQALRQLIKEVGERSGLKTGNINYKNDFKILWVENQLTYSGEAGFDSSKDTTNHLCSHRTEATIQEFLTLLEAYTPVKKDVVIEISSDLTATIKQGSDMVTITGAGSHTVAFSTIINLENTLAKPSTVNGFDNSYFYCVVPSYEVAMGIHNHLKSVGIGVRASNEDAPKRKGPYKVQWHGFYLFIDDMNNFNHLSPNKLLTIDQFLAKTIPTEVTLPTIAGYQVEKLNDNGAIKLGCQTIHHAQLQELFKAVKDAQNS